MSDDVRRIPKIDDREISGAWKTIYERDGAAIGEDTIREVFEDFLVGRGIFEYVREDAARGVGTARSEAEE